MNHTETAKDLIEKVEKYSDETFQGRMEQHKIDMENERDYLNRAFFDMSSRLLNERTNDMSKARKLYKEYDKK